MKFVVVWEISNMINLFGKSWRGIKIFGKASRISGFTLIELLSATVIAGIIVSSLLAFLVSILKQDQIQEAKAQTQDEVQAALDFIANDLKEAIYIYDADGVERSSTDTPSGIRDQIPDISTSTTRPGIPILVFWKRSLIDRNEAFSLNNPNFPTCHSNPSDNGVACRRVRSFEFGDANGSDVYVLSLVGYYLRTNRLQNGANSASMQIDRWEVRDGIKSTCTAGQGTTESTLPTECQPANRPPGSAPIVRARSGTNSNNQPIYDNYWVPPQPNFQRFSLEGIGSFRDKLNRYRSISGSTGFAKDFNNRTQVLLDYVDDTFYKTIQDNGVVDTNDVVIVPVRPNIAAPANPNNFVRDNPDCANPSIGVGRYPENGVVDGQFAIATQRIPSTFTASTTLGTATNASSFYVCVNSVQNIARVWIRGNGEARIRPLRGQRQANLINPPSDSLLATSSIRAAGRTSINASPNN